MSNTVDHLNVTNVLTCEDAILTSLVVDNMQTNSLFCDNALITNLSCNNITLDISQNLNLSGSLSALSVASNVLNCNTITANVINRTSDGSRFATIQDISNCYDSIIDGAPGALNTLKEIAQSINNEVSFSTMMFGRLNLIDNSYNTIIQPALNSKLTNIINQDIFLTGNLYIKPTNKFIQFLDSANNTMSSIITRSDYTTFNHVSSYVSGGWNFAVDGVSKLNIDHNGGINMNEDINCAGAITSTGINTSSEIKTNKLTFNGLPSINHIQRGTVNAQSNHGNIRLQFDKVFPAVPSVTASPIYSGLGYLISVIITAVDTSGFNYNVFVVSITGSFERFEMYCKVSWIAIG